MKTQPKFTHFHSSKCIWKYRLVNGGHFVSASMCNHRMRDWYPSYRREILQTFRQRWFEWRMSGFNNTFSIATQMRWKIHFTIIHIGDTGEPNCSWHHPIGPPKGPDWDCTICVGSRTINPLWPGDAIRRHRFWSTLAQVMACCLTAPSHYLNQC